MRIAAVIPSRFASKRFPGKPLAMIAGKSMIQRVYDRVKEANCFDRIIVATDDQRIIDEVNRFGGDAILTSSNLRSGSERVWQVIESSDFQGVVNIQGDEPLVSPRVIIEIYSAIRDGSAGVVTAAAANSDYKDFLSPHVVKVVMNNNNEALYFSRCPIPYQTEDNFNSFFHHIGIYAYSREELKLFMSRGPGCLEIQESLEQLRFLENGSKIKIIVTDCKAYGVDVPEDIKKIENHLRGRNG